MSGVGWGEKQNFPTNQTPRPCGVLWSWAGPAGSSCLEAYGWAFAHPHALVFGHRLTLGGEAARCERRQFLERT